MERSVLDTHDRIPLAVSRTAINGNTSRALSNKPSPNLISFTLRFNLIVYQNVFHRKFDNESESDFESFIKSLPVKPKSELKSYNES